MNLTVDKVGIQHLSEQYDLRINHKSKCSNVFLLLKNIKLKLSLP